MYTIQNNRENNICINSTLNRNNNIIVDNNTDLLKAFQKQTINNFNNKYRLKKIPKMHNKISNIFSLLKKYKYEEEKKINTFKTFVLLVLSPKLDKLVIKIIKDINKVNNDNVKRSNVFKIISSTSTKSMDNDIINYAKKEGFKVEIEHYGDLEIVNILNSNSKDYDAVWISNSLWFYMLDNSNLITDSKSIVIDPVVMGISKNKAKE